MAEEEYSSIPETLEHREQVKKVLSTICEELLIRGENHDESKMNDPELPYFNKYTPMLKKLTYGTDEYKKSLKDLGVALEHHYEENSHHPEHFENGLAGMTLMDLVELFADWMAASMRTKEGDKMKSVDIGEDRFEMDSQLASIFRNTIKEIYGDEEE